jgi:hypothetical protein
LKCGGHPPRRSRCSARNLAPFAERSSYQPFQGNEGRKDKRHDPDEGDGKEDVVHGAPVSFPTCEQRHAKRLRIGLGCRSLPRLGPSPMAGHSLKRDRAARAKALVCSKGLGLLQRSWPAVSPSARPGLRRRLCHAPRVRRSHRKRTRQPLWIPARRLAVSR